MPQKTLFITGVSSGLGRAFAQEALAAGHRVIGTVRNEAAKSEFEQLTPGLSFAKVLDVTNDAAIPKAVAEIESEIAPIDVLINNAGYGHEGLVEESTLQELRQQFEVNVFGAVAVIKTVLPYMRERRHGHIINITSMGGLITFPGISFYHGSKFALEGISSSLGKEVKPFGIHVTAVEPGGFRTDWAGRSMVRSERSIPDYDASFEPLRAARAQRSGKQQGDPAKAGKAILKLIDSPNPPAHLLLGSDAAKYFHEYEAALQKEVAEWESVTLSTDFD